MGSHDKVVEGSMRRHQPQRLLTPWHLELFQEISGPKLQGD